MTSAEYIARLKMRTQSGSSKVVNLIYGVDGMVVGNSDELLRVAEMLLKERDEWKRRYDEIKQPTKFGPDIGADGEFWIS